MNTPPPPTVSEEDITESAPFFNKIEEDDVENDIDIAKLKYFSVILLLIFRDTVSYVCFFYKRYRYTASKNHSFIIMFLSFFLI